MRLTLKAALFQLDIISWRCPARVRLEVCRGREGRLTWSVGAWISIRSIHLGEDLLKKIPKDPSPVNRKSVTRR